MRCLKPTWIINYVFRGCNDHVTVARAVNVLAYVLKSGQDSVIFADNKIQIFELGSHPDLSNLPADRVKIAFCGGPPGEYTTRNGTLLSFLVDRFVWEIIHGDTQVFVKLKALIGRGAIMDSEHWMSIYEK